MIYKHPTDCLICIFFWKLIFTRDNETNKCHVAISNFKINLIGFIFYFQRGPNKVPIYALILITLVSLLFIFVGDVNSLAPIVTTSFMMTYAAIDYAYFALAMSYDRRHEKELKYGPMNKKMNSSSGEMGNGCLGYGTCSTQTRPKDSFEKLATDLDSLFPERMTQRGQHHLARQNGSAASTPEADFDATKRRISVEATTDQNDKTTLLSEKTAAGAGELKQYYYDNKI